MITKDINELCVYLSNLDPKFSKGMGIDYGAKKTGIAISDRDLSMVLPLGVIGSQNVEVLLAQIKNLISQYEVGFLVLGFPDERYYGAEMYQKFAQILEREFPTTLIYLEDESFSSKLANEMLIEAGFTRRKRSKIDDKIAAKIILENCLEKIDRTKSSSIQHQKCS